MTQVHVESDSLILVQEDYWAAGFRCSHGMMPYNLCHECISTSEEEDKCFEIWTSTWHTFLGGYNIIAGKTRSHRIAGMPVIFL